LVTQAVFGSRLGWIVFVVSVGAEILVRPLVSSVRVSDWCLCRNTDAVFGHAGSVSLAAGVWFALGFDSRK
jgi:hypothetical protein